MSVIRATAKKIRTVCRFSARATAPEGGAQGLNRSWVRGCLFIAALGAWPLAAQSQSVPSGQPVTLSEVLEDVVAGEDWLRLRFVAPEIARDGGSVSYETAGADFAHLCDHVARSYMVDFDLNPDVVVISLMDRLVDFGATDPDATQFFEAFRITDDACVLDVF